MKQIIKPVAEKLAEIYKQDGRTFLYHLGSVALSTLACSATAGGLEGKCSPALNSAVTTGVGMGTYWTPFIGMNAVHDRNEMKDNGKYSWKKILGKAAQYASFVGIGEAVYGSIRGLVQYELQKHTDLDAKTASVITDLTCATAYGVLVPPISYGIKNAGKLKDFASNLIETEIDLWRDTDNGKL